MATVPVVPTFTGTVPSSADMTTLGTAAAWQSWQSNAWHCRLTADVSIAAATTLSIAWNSNVLLEGVTYTSPNITITTQGVYQMAANIMSDGTTMSAGAQWDVWLMMTAGANNPNFTSGTGYILGRGDQQLGNAGSPCVTLACAAALYSGDRCSIQAYSSVANTVAATHNTTGNHSFGQFVGTGMTVDGGSNFTGFYVCAV